MILFEIIFVVAIIFILNRQDSRLRKLEENLRIIVKQGVKSQNLQDSGSVAVTSTDQNLKPVTNTVVNNPSDSIIQRDTIQQVPIKETKVNSEEFSGRLLGRIGIAAVILGVSFFLKYAFDNNWVGPTGRVMVGVIIGIVLLSLGQYLRRKYLGYSDLLMGGGIGVLYLSMFSAFAFYHLISSLTAGILMLLVTILSFVISIVNATNVLAIVGVIGGLSTPFLLHSGNNEMVKLFTYLIILDLGVLGISFFKRWPVLVVVSFIGTILNFISWFGGYYSQSFILPTVIFCFVIFIIFLVSAIARAIVVKTVTDNLNYFVLGANAFFIGSAVYILLQPNHSNILGFISVFISIIYMISAFMVNKFNSEDKTINIFLPGLAVTFLSIAIPLQFSGPWVAVFWLVESVFLYIIASTISNRGFQVMGVVVYVLGLLNVFFYNYPTLDSKFIAIFNTNFVILILAIAVAYIIAFMYYKFGSRTVDIQKRGIIVFAIIANILTVYAFTSQIIFYHSSKILALEEQKTILDKNNALYDSDYNNSQQRQQLLSDLYKERSLIGNKSNTYVSIFWVLYAAVLTAIGFGRRLALARRLGLALFIITAFKVVVDVWSLGQIYRIVSLTVLGIVALSASFFYVKYRDRLDKII